MKIHDIAVIGGFPPPIGGVSVHVERLIRNLENESVKYILYNISKNKINANYNIFNMNNLKLWVIKYFFCCKDKIIHCHESNWYFISILCLIKKNHKSKIIVTIHSFREDPKEFNIFKKVCFFYSIKNIDRFISVGVNEKNKLIKYGCMENKISVIPAYINPKYNEIDDALIPEYVWNFMRKNDFNIVANAFRISFYNNEDLYGIDMCLDLCYRLKKHYSNKKIGFIFCLPDIGDYEYYNKSKDYIYKSEINNEFLFVNEIMPLYPILKKSELFLRPTNTDGDAVSIREALYYKVPAIASNVVKRPEGTILFRTRDIYDLYIKTIDVIENYDVYKEKSKDIKQSNNCEKILDIYKELNSHRKE